MTKEQMRISAAASIVAFAYVAVIGNIQEPGVSPDSVTYIEGATNLLQGNGLTYDPGSGKLTLITHWPPVFPMMLALFMTVLGTKAVTAAAWLNALSFSATVWLSNRILSKFVPSPKLVIAFNVVLITVLSQVHLMVWSEPLFLALALFVVTLILKEPEQPSPRTLLIASAAMGVLILTRYAGIAFLGSCLLYFVIFTRQHSAWKNIALLSVICVAIVATWVVIVKMQPPNEASIRPIGFHPPGLLNAREFVTTVSKWMAPGIQARYGILIFTATLAFAALLFPIKKALTSRRFLFLLFLSLGYLGFIVLSITLFDALTPLDYRILSPAFPLILLLFTVLAYERDTSRLPWANKAFPVFTIAVLILQVYSLSANSAEFCREGVEYTSRYWKSHELVNIVREGHRNKVIFTNGADVIKFSTGQAAYYLPFNINPLSTQPEPDYDRNLERLIRRLGPDTVIVYFDTLAWRDYMPSKDELIHRMGNSIIEEYAEGLILR